MTKARARQQTFFSLCAGTLIEMYSASGTSSAGDFLTKVNCFLASLTLCEFISVLSLSVPHEFMPYTKKRQQNLLQTQALDYDILLSTTAIFSYAIGSRKLSANEQFFVGAQTVVSLLQTTQIVSDVYFLTDHVAYASSNKTKIV